ncbi:hypothetical protein D047_2795B, partial [Vibrio parahaemolyticus VPTS-2010_2]
EYPACSDTTRGHISGYMFEKLN